MSEDTARFYCYCMVFKMEEKYPTIEEAAGLTEDKLQSPNGRKKFRPAYRATGPLKTGLIF